MTLGVEIQAVGIQRSFGPKVILNGLTVSAAPGEFLAVVGRSGCGKSTLLRLLLGLDAPDQGQIQIGGQIPQGPHPQARVVFQDGRLLPWLSVEANVALGLDPNQQDRAKEVLDEVGLTDRGNDWPSILSGGQRQRVALARALASSPRLLLFDEPLGSLDALTRLEMQQLIEKLWIQKQFTTVLITHDVEEAIALSDRVILLEGGRVAAEWQIPLDRPRNRGSQDFAALVQQVLSRVMASQPTT